MSVPLHKNVFLLGSKNTKLQPNKEAGSKRMKMLKMYKTYTVFTLTVIRIDKSDQQSFIQQLFMQMSCDDSPTSSN